MQMADDRDMEGVKIVSAFYASSFNLANGEEGQTELSLTVGAKSHINFVLPVDISAAWRVRRAASVALNNKKPRMRAESGVSLAAPSMPEGPMSGPHLE
jgi:hypothetical protein